MKTHFATKEQEANESTSFEIWGEPICNSFSENITDKWDEVSCKKCLKLKTKHDLEMKQAMEHNVRDMAGFVEFMERENKVKNG